MAQTVKNPPASARDASSIPGSGGFPGGGHGNPLQCSHLGNPWTEQPGGLQSMGSQRDATEHTGMHIPLKAWDFGPFDQHLFIAWSPPAPVNCLSTPYVFGFFGGKANFFFRKHKGLKKKNSKNGPSVFSVLFPCCQEDSVAIWLKSLQVSWKVHVLINISLESHENGVGVGLLSRNEAAKLGMGRKWLLGKGRDALPWLFKSLVPFCSRAWPSWLMASGIAVLLPTLCRSSLPAQVHWASLYLTSFAMLALRLTS